MTNQQYLGDPQHTHQAGGDIAATGERLKEAVQRFQERITGLTASKPWGDDDTGQAFAEKYVPAESEYFEAAPNVADLVNGVGKGVQAAVKLLKATDEANSDTFRKV